jgi:LPXTG-site transpeptidase (sortase) family protein
VIREAPLLVKVGVIVLTLALALAIVAVVVSIAVRSVPQQAVASQRETATESPVQRLIPGEVSFESWVEKARQLFTPEVAKGEWDPEPPGGEPKAGFTLNPEAEPRSKSESFPKPQGQSGSGSQPESHVQAEPQAGSELESYVQAGSEPQGQLQAGPDGQTHVQVEPQVQPLPSAQQEEPKAQPQSEPEQGTLLAGESEWQRPTRQEVEAANQPRHYNLLPAAIMGLTIEAIGIYDVPVFDSNSQWALANGVAHHPQTSLPWSPTPQRNVYLAGHRMGFRGTWSRMIFYNLDKLQQGDQVVLEDRAGTSYRYHVSEVLVVDPTDAWVMGQVRGKDLLTLQTCTPIPTFEKRLIVRADRV